MRKLQYILLLAYSLQLAACSLESKIGKQANRLVINDTSLATSHVGICVYNADDNKYLYNYQSDKYYIPASNTKIFTCYAAMKYLGDSLVGLRYEPWNNGLSIYIKPSGDPTFLHPDFKNQPVFNLLKQFKRVIVECPYFTDTFEGMGWSWDDYKDDYMVQRNNFPIYGNVMRVTKNADSISIMPSRFSFFTAETENLSDGFKINKGWENDTIWLSKGHLKYAEVPFTPTNNTIFALLHDTLHADVWPGWDHIPSPNIIIHSQPTDSLLKIMMHRSDNFYAEQSLLMVSNERLGVMNDERIIDTLLKTDLKDLPQRPQWVDGSGLSRFDLFTPQDFVYMLNKMKNEFGWQRISTIFETGNNGTLRNYYKGLEGKIFAKTGSLSNDIALSGYLITPQHKTLIFSVLVNNHTVSASAVRRAVERFLVWVQQHG